MLLLNSQFLLCTEEKVLSLNNYLSSKKLKKKKFLSYIYLILIYEK